MGTLAKRTKKSGIIKVVLEGAANVREFEINDSVGHFIKETRRAGNFPQLNEIVSRGIKVRSINPLISYLELTSKDLAQISGVSERTVARWTDDTVLASSSTKSLIKIDSLVKKGIEIFGSEESLKSWLQQPNRSFGNVAPLQLLSTPYGPELIEDALSAIEYGNVM
jgi:putative toxin-antitoxin system antitoxin component (TIGR02293 family)